ncbi:MAG: hypothetical protein NUW37_16490 [Planctomycetes bacterium]|nr:hypothetical protein [Planctomycetota bacterium]
MSIVVLCASPLLLYVVGTMLSVGRYVPSRENFAKFALRCAITLAFLAIPCALLFPLMLLISDQPTSAISRGLAFAYSVGCFPLGFGFLLQRLKVPAAVAMIVLFAIGFTAFYGLFISDEILANFEDVQQKELAADMLLFLNPIVVEARIVVEPGGSAGWDILRSGDFYSRHTSIGRNIGFSYPAWDSALRMWFFLAMICLALSFRSAPKNDPRTNP